MKQHVESNLFCFIVPLCCCLMELTLVYRMHMRKWEFFIFQIWIFFLFSDFEFSFSFWGPRKLFDVKNRKWLTGKVAQTATTNWFTTKKNWNSLLSIENWIKIEALNGYYLKPRVLTFLSIFFSSHCKRYFKGAISFFPDLRNNKLQATLRVKRKCWKKSNYTSWCGELVAKKIILGSWEKN